MRTFAALLLAVLTLFVAGCSKPEPIIGKWKNTGSKVFGKDVEFFPDKKFIAGTGVAGTWAVLDDGRLRLETNVQSAIYNLKYNEGNGVVTLLSSDNEHVTMMIRKELLTDK